MHSEINNVNNEGMPPHPPLPPCPHRVAPTSSCALSTVDTFHTNFAKATNALLATPALVGGAMYWLEMKTIIGWEKMMLVVGYATNEPICDRLAMVVRLDAPDRKFRCSTAN